MLHGPRCPPSQSAVAGAKWTSRSSVGLLGQHEAAPRLLTDACGADRCTTGAGSYPLASKDTDVLLPSHHLFPLRPVVNGRCVQPRLAPGAAAHRHGRQTWPNGRAAAHARFPHTRRLMETTQESPPRTPTLTSSARLDVVQHADRECGCCSSAPTAGGLWCIVGVSGSVPAATAAHQRGIGVERD